MPQVFLHGVTVNLTVCLLFCLNSCKNPHFEPLPKIQIYVHCDVVICDARNPLGGVCAGQCSQQAQGTKGKTLKILYYLTLNNHFGCFFFLSIFWYALNVGVQEKTTFCFITFSAGQRRAVPDGQVSAKEPRMIVSLGPLMTATT